MNGFSTHHDTESCCKLGLKNLTRDSLAAPVAALSNALLHVSDQSDHQRTLQALTVGPLKRDTVRTTALNSLVVGDYGRSVWVHYRHSARWKCSGETICLHGLVKRLLMLRNGLLALRLPAAAKTACLVEGYSGLKEVLLPPPPSVTGSQPLLLLFHLLLLLSSFIITWQCRTINHMFSTLCPSEMICCAFLLHHEGKKRSFQAEAALVTEASPCVNLAVSDSVFFFSYVLRHTPRLPAAGGNVCHACSKASSR